MRVRLLLAFTLLSGFYDDCGACTPLPHAATRSDYHDASLFDFSTLDGHVAGYSYAFMQAGAVVAAGAKGNARMEQDGREPMTAATRLHLASISKTITATTLMTLVESHGIDLDRPFLAWLGEQFPVHGRGVAAVTLRQLLNHTSGMVPQTKCDGDLLATLIATSTLYPPGEKEAYSNANYCILREVIEHVSGRGYVPYVQDHVLLPMGITDMTCKADDTLYYAKDALDDSGWFFDEDYTQVCGAYGWYGSALDVARFGDGLRRNLVIAASSFEQMKNGQFGLWRREVSTGMAYVHKGGWHHGEQGFDGVLALFPGELTAVLLVNSYEINQGSVIINGYEGYLTR